jgi:hypothetical protein
MLYIKNSPVLDHVLKLVQTFELVLWNRKFNTSKNHFKKFNNLWISLSRDGVGEISREEVRKAESSWIASHSQETLPTARGCKQPEKNKRFPNKYNSILVYNLARKLFGKKIVVLATKRTWKST